MSEPKTAEEFYADYRAKFQASAVAVAREHLGSERERYCEALGNFMAANFDMIWAAAAVKFAPMATVPGLDMLDLGKQMQQHAGKIAETAVHALEDLYLHTLVAAKMAYGSVEPPQNMPQAN